MKKIVLFLMSFTLFYCNNIKEKKIVTNGIKIPNKINKIISTAPSNTDIIVGLGLIDNLIVVSSYDKDSMLNDKLKIDFNNINTEFFIEQKPDIIVASSHNISHGINTFENLKKFNIPVIFIPTANNIEDIYESIHFLSKILNKEENGNEIVKNMKQNISKIKSITSNIKTKKTVYFEIDEWNGIMYSFGKNTFINSILQNIKAENIFNNQDSWIKPTSESIIQKNPDIIITSSMKENINTQNIYKRKGWENINAIKNSKVFWIDADMISRCSQKTINSHLSILKLIYPEIHLETN